MSTNFVQNISCGDYHTLLLTTSGFVYTFGKGENGRLGLGDEDYHQSPSLLYDLHDMKVTHIFCSSNASFALACSRDDSTKMISNGSREVEVEVGHPLLYVWGAGEGGVLGLGDMDNGGLSPSNVAVPE